MSFVALTTAETDAKSPIDDALLLKVKDNFDDLNSRVIAAGAAPFVLEIQGKLSKLTNFKRSIASGILNKEFTPTQCRYLLKQSGTSALGFDIRQHSSPRVPIIGIDHQYTAATSSIARKGTALNTQSISRATAQISTQSITFAKAAANIQSIIGLGTVTGLGSNLWQYNLDVTIDSDTLVGDSILIASATTGGNNGTFVILEKNRGGGKNVVVSNASGAAQTGVAGTAQLQIMSYNFTNPVSVLFGAGYSVHFASHTSALNNGDFTIYAINSGGNNILVKNSVGIVQASTPGTADTNLFLFVMTGAVSTTDYIVGEKALTATHTTGANNGTFTIAGVNQGGNNVMLNVPGGATQGGIAGTVNTNRWVYNLPSDPTSNVTIGDTIWVSGSTNALNDGVFTTKDVTVSTFVVYNESGVAQGGAVGNVFTTRKLIKFATNQSANFTTDSYIEMQGCVDALYDFAFQIAPFKVLQVNRGGGANFNVVIDNPLAAAQASPSGYVQTEMKSIFTALPSLAADLTSLVPNQNVAGSSTAFVGSVVAVNTPLMLYITSLPSGDPQDLSVILT